MQKRRDFIRTAALGSAGLAVWPQLNFAQPSAAEEKFELRFRQVHLDFHTSQHIAGIGAQFDPAAFAATLDKARVNSVTCFARCHHGYIYYDTKAHPERKHPALKRNLLKEQIEACHQRNIRVPIYVTVGWDQYTADAHPEWRQVLETGVLQGTPPYEPGFYRLQCLNSPYRDFLKAHIKDIFECVPVDGIFLDIIKPNECSCPRCQRAMVQQGLNPANAKHRQQYGWQVMYEWQREMSAHIRSFDKRATIFYNGGHVGTDLRPVVNTFSHWELESLPSGGWGYLHFPLAQRYARTLGLDSLGMTGKFHTSWGDFHSLKNKEALQFECFQMLALNAKCSVGDQLHPTGKLDPATYELIGSVFAEVEKKEPWCKGARALTDIAILSVEEFIGGRVPPPNAGAVRMLQEGAQQFDIIDSKADFAPYKVLLLPDEITVNPELASKLNEYLSKGGALLASYHSGLNPAKEAFALSALGVKLKGDAPFSPDFVRVRERLSKGMPPGELVMYLKGLEVEASTSSEVLAEMVVPYFNRTWEHYSSHRHTPSAGKVGYPGVVKNGRCVYFTHPIFSQYHKNAPRWCKRLVLNALELLLPEPLVKVEGPTTLLTALNEQAAEGRAVLHLLHYIPERRGTDFDVIEDVIPLFNLKASVKLSKRVKEVVAVPERERLPFENKNGRIEFTLPKLNGHQMIAFVYA
jgi:hypothetical protein